MRKKHVVAAGCLISAGFFILGCHPVTQEEFDALQADVNTLTQEVTAHSQATHDWATLQRITLLWMYECHTNPPCAPPTINPPPPPSGQPPW